MGFISHLYNKKKKQPIIPSFRFELEVFEGKKALKELDNLVLVGEDKGFTPILIGGEDEFNYFEDQFEINETSIDQIIQTSKSINVDEFFNSKFESDPEYYSVETTGPKPDASPKGGLTAHLNPLNRNPLDWVFIAKVPDLINNNIPAHFSFGNWNDCPSPEEHVAIWKYWHEKFGAKIVCVTHDVIEAKISNPPMSYDEALILAREQFIYCADIIHQGVGSLENLAALLQNGSTWYFWWD